MAVAANDKACIVAHPEKLPPCPEGEVIAVALSCLLEVLGRLPIIFLSKLLLVGDVSTSSEETPHLVNGLALNPEWLIEIPRYWKSRMRASAAKIWANYSSSNYVIGTGNYLCDQSRIMSQ